jgi:hypothetical protein
VPPSHLLIETGYRNQVTTASGGTSTLSVFPLAVARIGLGKRTEFIAQFPAYSSRTGGALGGVFSPATGTQDSGFGFKLMLADRPSFQHAVEVFYTAPTGTPQGTTGFSAGAPTYTLTYTAAVPVNGRIGLSLTQNFIANAAPSDPSGAMLFFSYQPSLALSYGFAPSTTLIVSGQITTPAGPSGGTSNRGLIAVQRVVSPGIVVDVEYEANLSPALPAQQQHAAGFGAAFQL